MAKRGCLYFSSCICVHRFFTVTGHLVHPWHFVHPDIWSTWTFGLKTTGTPWHIVSRQLVYPDILSKDNSYTLTFHTPYFVMSWLKYQRVYQMSWTFRTPFPYSFLMKGCTKCHGHLVHPFLIGFLLKGCTKRHGHLVHPSPFLYSSFGPWHLVHPDIRYTQTFGTP